MDDHLTYRAIENYFIIMLILMYYIPVSDLYSGLNSPFDFNDIILFSILHGDPIHGDIRGGIRRADFAANSA